MAQGYTTWHSNCIQKRRENDIYSSKAVAKHLKQITKLH